MTEVALFGAGRIGKIHAGNVARQPGVKLRYVIDVDAAAAKALADQHGAQVVSAEAALGDKAVGAVVIGSSTDTHADLITRAAMLDVLSQDYVRTANAKGLAPRAVLIRHALKNAGVPIVTVIGLGIALLISGAIVTETVFAIPGIGRLTVDAILRRDYPIIQGVILLFSAVYVLINLLVDLSYRLFDPRIRY